MTKAAARLFLAGAGLLVLSSGLGAQTLPLPQLPPETIPEPEAPSSPGAAGEAPQAPADEPTRPKQWEFALGAGLAWDGNTAYPAFDGPSDTMLVPRGGIARAFRSPHGELRATANGLWSGYREQEDLRRYYADFGLDGRYSSSPRTRWEGSAFYGIGDSASAPILREQGVALPRVKTRSLSSTVGVSRGVGRRGSLRLEGRFSGTDFDAPELIDGSSARATVGLERGFGTRNTVGISYALEDVLSDLPDSSYFTHFAAVQWTRVVSRRTALLLQGGASSTAEAARAGLAQNASFFGGATFTGASKRSSFTLFLRREVTPAFGTGDSRLDLRGGVRATIAMGKAWELGIDTTHVRPDETETGTAQGATYDAMASLGRRVGGWVYVSGEARYRRLGAAGVLPAIEELQAGFFLSLSNAPGLGSGLLR